MNRMATTFSNRIPLRSPAGDTAAHSGPLLITLVFLALPWSIEHKAHLALHGLCAQRPSHTYTFNGRLLPFDARMTGIYSGFLVTTSVLFAERRAPVVPSTLVLATRRAGRSSAA